MLVELSAPVSFFFLLARFFRVLFHLSVLSSIFLRSLGEIFSGSLSLVPIRVRSTRLFAEPFVYVSLAGFFLRFDASMFSSPSISTLFVHDCVCFCPDSVIEARRLTSIPHFRS